MVPIKTLIKNVNHRNSYDNCIENEKNKIKFNKLDSQCNENYN